MNKGIKTLIYPVKDIAQARDIYSTLLGVKPYMDEAYYVGFRVDGQEIGLDPHAQSQGMAMPVAYYQVEDIQKSLETLVDAGARIAQEPKDVGYGKLIATATDTDGNLIGLIQLPVK